MGNLIKLNFELKNDSKISGDEVFQVYIKDIDASFRTPNSSLIFFKRIHLKSGEKRKINIIINEDMMAMVNKVGEKQIESGDFKIYVGGSSPGQRSEELGKYLMEAIFTVE